MEDAIDQSSNGSLSNPLDLIEHEIEINPCAKVSCNKQQWIRIQWNENKTFKKTISSHTLFYLC